MVGTRTCGGLVGTLGVPAVIDGNDITAPILGFYDLSGRRAIENEGVSPDIEVVTLRRSFASKVGSSSRQECLVRVG